MIEHLWLVPLGFVAGVIGSITGLGGGIVTVPVMTILGFPPALAASNSLFATLSNAVASTISYSRRGIVEFSLGVKLGLLSVPGTVLGAIISTDVTPVVFKVLFGLVLVASAVYILAKRKIELRKKKSELTMVFVIGASFFAGLISAFFGIGGGIVFVPLMVVGMGMAMKTAAPTSQFILIFASLSGAIAHSMLGHPEFIQAGLISLGSFFGGLAGARIALELKEKFLRILICIVILVAATKMFVDSEIWRALAP